MRYIGGKSKLAKRIAADILKSTSQREVYLEPFLGGGAVLGELAPNFRAVYASDLQQDLMLMWSRFQQGWEPPDHISEEDYRLLKNAHPSAWRGLIGFGQSFGGKWFGGYARGNKSAGSPRNYLDETIRNIKNIIDKLPDATNFTNVDYKRWYPVENDVVYADPPYASTQGYNSTGSFNTQEFWHVMDKWRQSGVEVFVSEYKAPEGWDEIASYSHRQELALCNDRFETTERLWH